MASGQGREGETGLDVVEVDVIPAVPATSLRAVVMPAQAPYLVRLQGRPAARGASGPALRARSPRRFGPEWDAPTRTDLPVRADVWPGHLHEPPDLTAQPEARPFGAAP